MRAKPKLIKKKAKRTIPPRQPPSHFQNISESLDPLTQIYQPDYFFQRLTEQLSKDTKTNEPTALILCQVIPNNSPYLPHDRSDLEAKIFRELVGVLKKNIRYTDILARISHYQFGILLPQSNPERAEHFRERIQTLLDKLPILQKYLYQVEVKMAPCPAEAYPLMHLICPSTQGHSKMGGSKK